jgi:eukaryotic-like serine/threonine-protein kinase
MSAKAPDFQPGTMLPGTKYRIVRQIGAGGMGVVYQVVKPPEIQGVLKLMSSDLTAHQEFRTRFLDEVRVLAQLDHPNIVKVFDYDTLTDGTPYYVMELLHGRTVRDVLATMGTIPPRVAFEIARQLCEALHCAHTHDIPVIHRDIKPENIFLHAPRHGEPVVKLIDFGVVAVADRQHDGAFVGTWKYAAPEQIRGERATPATDLYAVGLVLYEMLCGIGPFEHLDSGSLVSQAHLKEMPPPVSKFAPWVPPSIVQLIDASLAKEPRQRPRDAYGFAERLYELEWANDGKDPNDRTSEGPLSRILSTVGVSKPSSKNMVAAAPKDRLANVPVIGIPAEARHGGPTIKGVGGNTHELTSPGEDALLAGLMGRADLEPRSKKGREPGGARVAIDATPQLPVAVNRPANVANVEVPTLDAPPAGGADALTDVSYADASTRKLARPVDTDTDTFSSQESDTRRIPRGRGGRFAIAIVIAAVALIGIGTFAAYRGHRTTAVTPPPSAPSEAPTAIGVTAAEVTAAATGSPTPPTSETATTTTTAPVPTGRGRHGRGRGEPSAGTAAPTAPTAPTATTAPAKPHPATSSKPDDSMMRTFQ